MAPPKKTAKAANVKVELAPLPKHSKINNNPHLVYFVILDKSGVQIGEEICPCFLVPGEGELITTGDGIFRVVTGPSGFGLFPDQNEKNIIVPYCYLRREEKAVQPTGDTAPTFYDPTKPRQYPH